MDDIWRYRDDREDIFLSRVRQQLGDVSGGLRERRGGAAAEGVAVNMACIYNLSILI